ncbi:hypothetical protein B9Z55_001591 [Caenorhabditis nigoni]|uniref:Uncharacterized protein n=1 Tax=Caenorhabditis nigoni TaxID=1611254 RepID=A0A2G5VGP8_9PELO|nr:hypothetical protein B9Z55_001591 [Caenorhabditis nigoni]
MDLTEQQIRGLPHQDLINCFLQMREEFNEFQTSSSEIEKMMDTEMDELRSKLKKEESKDRQEESRVQWINLEEQLRRENAELQERCERQKERILKLEQRNDALETSERNKEFLSLDLGTKLDQAVEKIAMLESELHEKQEREHEHIRTSERPRLIVEPLRNDPEMLPDEPSPGPSKEEFRMSIDDVHMEDVQDTMEETISKIDEVCIDDNKNIQAKVCLFFLTVLYTDLAKNSP